MKDSKWMGNRYNKKKKNIEDLQKKWLVRFLGLYAENAIREKNSKDYLPIFTSLKRITDDERRCPTALKYLKSLNLVKEEEYVNQRLVPIDENVIALMAKYSEEPQFNSKGVVIKEKYSLSVKHIVRDIRENFIDVDELTAENLMHVFLNSSLYHFEEIKKVKKYHYQYESLYCYLKDLINVADQNSFNAILEEYCKKNICEVLSYIFKTEIKHLHIPDKYLDDDGDFISFLNLNQDNYPFFDLFDFKINFDFTSNAFSEKIKSAEEAITHLKKMVNELELIKSFITKLGKESFNKKILEGTKDYLSRKAPLWLYDDDEKKKRIAHIILKGTTIITDHITAE